MHKLLIPLSAALLFASPSYADFGDAETLNTAENESTKFTAKCGDLLNDCTLDFQGEKLIINGSNYVRKGQLKEVRYSIQERKCAFTLLTGNNCAMPYQRDKFSTDINYTKNDGSNGNAKIVFRNLNTGRRFFDTIVLFIGANSSDISKEGLTGYVVNKKKNTGTNSKTNIPILPLTVGIGAGLSISFGTMYFLKKKKQ